MFAALISLTAAAACEPANLGLWRDIIGFLPTEYCRV